jgi:hypothetical protein
MTGLKFPTGMMTTALLRINDGSRFSSWLNLAVRRLQDPFLLFLIVAGMYWRLVLTNQFQWIDSPDMLNQVLPWFEMQAHAWHSGQFPLWDPFHWLGQSLIGQVQPGVLYPLNWLLFLLPFRDDHIDLTFFAWYFVVIHYVAALFSYFLCRDLKCGRLASIFGGAAFTFSGYFAGIAWPQVLNGATWAPLVFLFLFRVIRGERPLRNALFLGTAYGFSFLSGHHQAPTFIGLAVGFTVIYAAVKCWPRKQPRLGLMAAGLIAVFTVLVSAAQMLPAIEYGQHSFRWVNGPNPVTWGVPVPYSVHSMLATRPMELLSALIPYGSILGPFIGFVLAVLAVLGIAANWNGNRRHETRILTALAVGTYLYSIGPYFVFHGILYSLVPMLEKARSANLDYVVSACCIPVLAAFGLEAIQRVDLLRSIEHWLPRMERALLAVGCALAAFVFVTTKVVNPVPSDEDLIMMGALVALPLAALLYALRSKQVCGRTFAVLALGLGMVEWGNATNRLVLPLAGSNHISQLYGYDDIAAFLQGQQDIVRVDVSNKLIPFNFGDWEGIDQRFGYLASVSTDVFNLAMGQLQARPLLGVNYVIAKAPESATQTEVFTGKSGLKVYKDSAAFPRVWTVHSAVAADMSVLSGFDAQQWRHQAFLESEPPPLESCSGDDAPRIVDQNTQSVNIFVKMNCRGMLILSDAYFPGWKATVDGNAVQIEKAYGALRGVVVPAGTHTVIMRYRPASFLIGATLSVLGLILAALLVMFPRFMTGQPEDTPTY